MSSTKDKAGAAKTDNLRQILHTIEETTRKQTNELTAHTTRLQTELVLRIEGLESRLTTMEGLLGNKAKPRTERKTAPAKATGDAAAAGAATGATAGATASAIKIPSTWIQFLSYKFQTDEKYRDNMLSDDARRTAAEGAANLDKAKNDDERNKKMATALSAWIKQNDTELMETLKGECKAFKDDANKPAPAVQQAADPDSE